LTIKFTQGMRAQAREHLATRRQHLAKSGLAPAAMVERLKRKTTQFAASSAVETQSIQL
jgi:hypothetical protein